MELKALKAAYRIPAAWRDLGLPGRPGKICRSPFPGDHKNGDANPSFSVFDDGLRAKDFASGEHFDVFDFIRKTCCCDMAEAIRFVEDHLGIPRPEHKWEVSICPNTGRRMDGWTDDIFPAGVGRRMDTLHVLGIHP
jgi:hypothetical protein